MSRRASALVLERVRRRLRWRSRKGMKRQDSGREDPRGELAVRSVVGFRLRQKPNPLLSRDTVARLHRSKLTTVQPACAIVSRGAEQSSQTYGTCATLTQVRPYRL